MEPNVLAELKSLLTEEKTLLEKELASFATPDPRIRDNWNARFPAEGGDTASHSAEEEQADIREAYEADLSQEQSLELRLREVNQAIARMEQGTYGRCQTCNQPIPEARLRANPAAAYDMEHQPA